MRCQCRNCVRVCGLPASPRPAYSTDQTLGQLVRLRHQAAPLVHLLLHPGYPAQHTRLRRCRVLHLQLCPTTGAPWRRDPADAYDATEWRRRAITEPGPAWSSSRLGRRAAGWCAEAGAATTDAVRITWDSGTTLAIPGVGRRMYILSWRGEDFHRRSWDCPRFWAAYFGANGMQKASEMWGVFLRAHETSLIIGGDRHVHHSGFSSRFSAMQIYMKALHCYPEIVAVPESVSVVLSNGSRLLDTSGQKGSRKSKTAVTLAISPPYLISLPSSRHAYRMPISSDRPAGSTPCLTPARSLIRKVVSR